MKKRSRAVAQKSPRRSSVSAVRGRRATRAATKVPAKASAALPATLGTALRAQPASTGTALAVLPLADVDTLQRRLQAYDAARSAFVAWLLSKLVPGVDYVLIHPKIGGKENRRDCPNKRNRKARRCSSCGGKASLAKPGAEKICGLLNVQPRFVPDHDTMKMLGSVGAVAYVCQLVSRVPIESSDGSVQIVEVPQAEGRGARLLKSDHGDANKSIKMAQKSAMIDAVLRLAGLSEVLTQDIDDGATGGYEPSGDDPDDAAAREREAADAARRRTSPPQRASSARAADAVVETSAREVPASSTETSGDPLQRLLALAAQHGRTRAQLVIRAAADDIGIKDLERQGDRLRDAAIFAKLVDFLTTPAAARSR